MLRLIVMQNFRSIGIHLHIGINKETSLGYDAPKPWRWQMSSMHLWSISIETIWEQTPIFESIKK